MFGFPTKSHVVIVFAVLFRSHFNSHHLGQQARDALLLIMQLSHRNSHIARHIVESTNFCPVRSNSKVHS